MSDQDWAMAEFQFWFEMGMRCDSFALIRLYRDKMNSAKDRIYENTLTAGG